MDSRPIIAVLKGGVSPEREVSLKSGEAAAEALGRLFRVEVFDVIEEALPIGLGPRRHVAFSTLHGVFGEDGQVQRLMEEAGVVYAGCDSESSHVTFDKARTKDLIANVACPVLDDARFQRDAPPEPEEVVEKLGGKLALKPNRQGSSIGLRLLEGAEALGAAMKDLEFEDWLIEPLVEGREVSVGIVGDAVGEIVEIIPRSGQYDYESKYTKGMTDYRAPADLDPELSTAIKRFAKQAFDACGCRDFARVDFMIDQRGRPWTLEINSLPGLTETSLLPMSAKAGGLDYENLLRRLVEPAFARFIETYPKKYSTC